jgi:hypothetical protein
MQAAPYSGTSSVRTILNHGCSTTFIVVDKVGEMADEAEEKALAVLTRRVVVVGMTRGGTHDSTEGSRESEEEGEHATRRETV